MTPGPRGFTWTTGHERAAAAAGIDINHLVYIHDRRSHGIDCTEDDSAMLKRYFRAFPDGPLTVRLRETFIAEWNES
jgi:hypothetical protein